jgi:type VI secretion system protein VasI
MIGHATLLFEFVPFNSSPAMTTFDLRGLAEAVKPLREACEW